MRRLDLHPKKKFRGQGRRLREFHTRLQRITQHRLEPDDLGCEYYNWKIPIYQKALLGRRKIANRWLKAWFAYGIEWLENQDPQYISCVITSLPDGFASEYCTFFSHEYFQSFIHRQNVWQTWDRVESPSAPCFMNGFDLSRYTFIEYDEIIRDEEDGYEFRGKQYILGHHLPVNVLG
ncbi:hypothetical protein C5Y96_00530 [Blastopirellula marina]|uniref:DUF3916 domain-containing protein n=1 Tax=Blastopirellula marina TaxID=124 RepID=A0A2S8G9U0_9BACT|nr:MULTISPECIES: DUF3916 domain-containing protein [Pirellulaceae]PQO41235.1 hypothetical protein C5Y96_00530 [Blastopirellula marina]RCS56259.1 DUF3916 domain-containing protein [Bremerella cremea]